MAKTELHVEDMSCNHCKMAIEKALKSMAGVTGVNVDLPKKTVTIDFDDAKTSQAEIANMIEATGYTVA